MGALRPVIITFLQFFPPRTRQVLSGNQKHITKEKKSISWKPLN